MKKYIKPQIISESNTFETVSLNSGDCQKRNGQKYIANEGNCPHSCTYYHKPKNGKAQCTHPSVY